MEHAEMYGEYGSHMIDITRRRMIGALAATGAQLALAGRGAERRSEYGAAIRL